MTSSRIDPETAVLDDDPPVARCPYCKRPFASERSCALHLGEKHPDEWTADEETAYEEATDDEEHELWMYHVKVIIALAVIYGVIVVIYMIILG
jgi:hypothetical protein